MKESLKKRMRAAACCSISLGFLVVAIAFAQPAAAQSGRPGAGVLQKKIADLKASTASNQSKLHQYTWTQTSRISLNGEVKKVEEFSCHYGPDGKVVKTPIGGQADSSSSQGGRFRQRVVAKKKAEMKDYMGGVGHVLALYLPPNPTKIQQAFQEKKVSLARSNGDADIVIKDYALPDDSMTIGFDSGSKKIQTLNVHTYVKSPQEPVTLLVEFSTLPDGTNYPLRTTLDAQAKKLNVVNTNTNYRKGGQ